MSEGSLTSQLRETSFCVEMHNIDFFLYCTPFMKEPSAALMQDGFWTNGWEKNSTGNTGPRVLLLFLSEGQTLLYSAVFRKTDFKVDERAFRLNITH